MKLIRVKCQDEFPFPTKVQTSTGIEWRIASNVDPCVIYALLTRFPEYNTRWDDRFFVVRNNGGVSANLLQKLKSEEKEAKKHFKKLWNEQKIRPV